MRVIRRHKQNQTNTWLLFLTGITVGAVSALLFAPQKGSESIQKISDSVSKLSNYLTKKIKNESEAVAEGVTDSSAKTDYTV